MKIITPERKQSSLVEDYKSVLESADSMAAIIDKNKTAVAIAAPQVGIYQRFFVMKFGDKMELCVNPEYEVKPGMSMVSDFEGCLSFPGNFRKVKRYRNIRATWINQDGVKVTKNLKEWTSRVFQHETDHLDGVDIMVKGER